MTTFSELRKRLDDLGARHAEVCARMKAELTAFEDTSASREERRDIERESARINAELVQLSADAERAKAAAITNSAAVLAREARGRVDAHLAGLQPPPSPGA